MISLIERIKNAKLPVKQLRVIESILDDLDNDTFLTGQELCVKYKTSFSSLTRLSKSLDYSGFPELKKEIERHYKNEYSPSSRAELFFDNLEKKSILDIVYESEIKDLNRLRKSLSGIDLLECAKRINNSNRVFIIGIGQLDAVALKLNLGLRLFGKQTVLFNQLGFSKACDIYKPTSKDSVIFLSMNKELIEMNDFMKKLKEENIFTTLFTDKKSGHLRKLATLSFFTPSQGRGAINCLTSYLVLSNILESFILSLDKHVHLSKIKKVEKSWSSLPIFIN